MRKRDELVSGCMAKAKDDEMTFVLLGRDPAAPSADEGRGSDMPAAATTDREALLAAILARPADDAPRLVYADWLDETAGTVECGECVDGDVGCPACHGAGIYYDPPYSLNRLKCPKCNDGLLPDKCKKCGGTGRISNGNAERAEFIRVQCELAAMDERGEGVIDPHEGHTCCEDPCPICVLVDKYESLRRRERELGFANFRSWFGFEKVEGHVACINDVRFVSEDATYFVRRGFVDELRTTLAGFLGRPCGRCEGQGHVTYNPPRSTGIGDWVQNVAKCESCHGSGRTPGAVGVFAREPVSAVRIVDREPYRTFGGTFGWNHDEDSDNLVEERAVLPGFLWDLLEPKGQRRNYVSRDAALSALNRVATNYGRESVKLPALAKNLLDLTKVDG